jgi:hypothetical protein
MIEQDREATSFIKYFSTFSIVKLINLILTFNLIKLMTFIKKRIDRDKKRINFARNFDLEKLLLVSKKKNKGNQFFEGI